MPIMVHFRDDTVSFVPDRDLVDLILSDRIVAFRRGSEWVNLEVAAIQRTSAQAQKPARSMIAAPARGDVWKRVMITDAR